MSDGRRCGWCGGVYFERTCEQCENMQVDENRHAHHDGRHAIRFPGQPPLRPLFEHEKQLIRDKKAADPVFKANAEAFGLYLDRVFGKPEKET